jgi:hypothetical protein
VSAVEQRRTLNQAIRSSPSMSLDVPLSLRLPCRKAFGLMSTRTNLICDDYNGNINRFVTQRSVAMMPCLTAVRRNIQSTCPASAESDTDITSSTLPRNSQISGTVRQTKLGSAIVAHAGLHRSMLPGAPLPLVPSTRSKDSISYRYVSSDPQL